MAEVGVARARPHDQVVKREGFGIRLDDVGLRVDPEGLGEKHPAVLLTRKDASNGRCDVRRVQRCGRHLVKHGLEEVVVFPVDECDRDRRVAERAGRLEPREPAAENDHARRR